MSKHDAEAMPHKERLLHHGMRLFYAQGFHGTTVDAILASAEVPKGSFYHHFGSKEKFGQAVLDRYMEFQVELFDKWASKDGLRTPQKLAGYFKEMSQLFVRSGYQRACLTGKFSTEVAATSELFRGQLDRQLQSWKSRLIKLLRDGQRDGDVRRDWRADELAAGVLAMIQGAFVIAISTRDRHTLAAVGKIIPLLVAPPA